jgi:hypothetical protein
MRLIFELLVALVRDEQEFARLRAENRRLQEEVASLRLDRYLSRAKERRLWS